MRFYKLTESGYITGIGTGGGGEDITAAEYADIMTAIQGKPTESETVGYRLKTDLTWEPYEKEPVDVGAEYVTPEEIAEALEGIT